MGETSDGNENDSSSLPKSPKEIEIGWSDGGGMMDLSTSIFISLDSSSWDYRRNGNEKHILFETSDEELKELYQVIRDNQFDRIKIRSEGEVYDRGGVSIRLNIDGKYYDVYNSGSYFIEDDWVDNWRAVSDAITAFSATKTEELKFDCFIKMDESIITKNYPMKLSVDGPMIFNSDDGNLTEDQIQNGFTLRMLEGPTQIDLYLFYPDSTNSYGGMVIYTSEMFSFDFSSEQSKATLYLEADQILIK